MKCKICRKNGMKPWNEKELHECPKDKEQEEEQQNKEANQSDGSN